MLVDSIEYGLTQIMPSGVISYNFIRSDKVKKQWIAKIDGICPKFGYKRKFLPYKIMKSENFLLKKFVYEIEPFKIYQYRNLLVSDKEYKFIDGYFAATIMGIIELESEQIRLMLNMPVKSWLHKGEVKIGPLRKGNYVREDIDF